MMAGVLAQVVVTLVLAHLLLAVRVPVRRYSEQDAEDEGDDCSPGEMFYKDCNMCTCSPSGSRAMAACTMRGCAGPYRREVGGTVTRILSPGAARDAPEERDRREVGGTVTRHMQQNDAPLPLHLTEDFRGIDRETDDVKTKQQ